MGRESRHNQTAQAAKKGEIPPKKPPMGTAEMQRQMYAELIRRSPVANILRESGILCRY